MKFYVAFFLFSAQSLFPLAKESLYYLKKEPPLDPTIQLQEVPSSSKTTIPLDPGAKKWVVRFHEIVGDSPFALLTRRVYQTLWDQFLPVPQISSQHIEQVKTLQKPLALSVSARGYLPGERVTFRVLAQDGRYKQLSWVPIPLRSKTAGGEMFAELKSVPASLYEVTILPKNLEEEYEFKSYSANEMMSRKLKGPMTLLLRLQMDEFPGGSSIVKAQFPSGEPCRLELLWGYRLNDFLESIENIH